MTTEELVKRWRKLVDADLWDGQGEAGIILCDETQSALGEACDICERQAARIKRLEGALKDITYRPPFAYLSEEPSAELLVGIACQALAEES